MTCEFAKRISTSGDSGSRTYAIVWSALFPIPIVPGRASGVASAAR